MAYRRIEWLESPPAEHESIVQELPGGLELYSWDRRYAESLLVASRHIAVSKEGNDIEVSDRAREAEYGILCFPSGTEQCAADLWPKGADTKPILFHEPAGLTVLWLDQYRENFAHSGSNS